MMPTSAKDHDRWCRWNGMRTKRRLKRAAELRERARRKLNGSKIFITHESEGAFGAQPSKGSQIVEMAELLKGTS